MSARGSVACETGWTGCWVGSSCESGRDEWARGEEQWTLVFGCLDRYLYSVARSEVVNHVVRLEESGPSGLSSTRHSAMRTGKWGTGQRKRADKVAERALADYIEMHTKTRTTTKRRCSDNEYERVTQHQSGRDCTMPMRMQTYSFYLLGIRPKFRNASSSLT